MSLKRNRDRFEDKRMEGLKVYPKKKKPHVNRSKTKAAASSENRGKYIKLHIIELVLIKMI